MKNWDLLLEWMTHLGSGVWGSFREAASELAGDDADEQVLVRTLRIALSDLGHADFFVDGSRRWSVLRPALVELSANGEHLLVGGRTRSLLQKLMAAATQATVRVDDAIPGLSRVQVVGDPASLSAVAQDLGIEYFADAGARLCAQVSPIKSVLDAAASAQEPINWSVRSWSFNEKEWVSARLPRTVREYSNRHNVRRYLVHAGRVGLLEVEKRASIYCAAVLRGTRFLRYSPSDKQLRVPWWAPLPASYARAVCLAGGQLGTLSGDDILFENIDPRVASMLLVSLGQGFPMPEANR